MFNCPGESKRAAEIVRHEINGAPDSSSVQELLDEFRQAVERPIEVGRHFRMAEAREIRGDAAIVRREALDDALPHDAAVRITVEHKHRRPGAPFGHVDIGAADADCPRRWIHGFVFRHRHAPACERWFIILRIKSAATTSRSAPIDGPTIFGYSITVSALEINAAGTSRPSAFAVFRLIANMSFV